ncbi:holo-ACP synthase [Paenibacillus sp. J5C_2022]|uniref:holo-ACP synthase n=1 Tax=Paenibacillus sp. J5C2022 TaxID=2977129 RepID=UPI0021D21264|nr:holo-ACP synthase [Paenibacillus sp. J5C2022]MCU6712214.1 holo-ACP synthase [Paenibacillus sp. J5C2022]
MITGIGHDMTDVDRIAEAVGGRAGQRFMERVLTEAERKLASSYSGVRLHGFVAGRFAAKEAVVKAFGCGIGAVLGFQDVEILPDANGKPVCTIGEAAWSRLGLQPEYIRLHLTITHEKSIASAFAVAERV